MTQQDPIRDYLDQLRAGLRVAPDEAELILAEAEDHLREAAAAAIAIGMTEREAREAAISSFGPVRAVVRAHEAPGRVAAIVGGAAAATWELASLLVAAAGVSGLATDAIWAMIRMPQPIVNLPSGIRAVVSPATNISRSSIGPSSWCQWPRSLAARSCWPDTAWSVGASGAGADCAVRWGTELSRRSRRAFSAP